MKIFITGATGFIGRQLVATLAEHELRVLTRDVGRARDLLGEGIQYLTDLNRLENFNDVDAVINLAGEPIVGRRWSDAQKHVLKHSRWDITSTLTGLIQQSDNPPAVFISGSAVGFYGNQGNQVVTEASLPVDDFAHEICATWEQLALEAASPQTRVCIIRTGVVLALGGGALAKMLPPFRLGLGGPIGSGNQGISWIHMDDMIRLIHFLLSNPGCRGIYNACAPNPVSNRDFAGALGRALHRPALLPVPELALKLLLGEASTMVTGGQYVLPQRVEEAGFRFLFPKIDQAMEAIFPD
ncbi:TIGR01777 family oxidoreductase [Shewanella cyperi]|uniref:TIGR01777 family oxidoreductase n=1 Tax=Shewanella cyperi TaxID=2814292 RepID=A0A975AK34_9GAMM|nr:TIGR01777 family oxidoreductase [Shewanella cyperi]QSX28788.1 TIGR01777 family oxidoreductase [Shewanella cyperi]QSX39527.1 TIGR01777 family oxidoreductase [Shewanella cyperi]